MPDALDASDSADADRTRLRARFTEAADLYDRARPGYPDALFDDLVALAGLREGARILEIGPGAGQATLPLARRGFAVTAVELGMEMAAVARAKLAPYPRCTVHVATFEEWPLPAEPFDLVLAATAWHWIDPATGFVRAARALRRGGHLAVIDTRHVEGGTSQFFVDIQEGCYARWMGDDATLRLQESAALPAVTAGFAASGLFGEPTVRLYHQDIPYTTRQYLDVLNTYSGHRDLPANRRDGLLGCIAAIIDTRFGGAIVKRYRDDLVVSPRL